MKKVFFNILIVYILCISTASAAETISVFVSIIPQKYFVEKIGGKFVNVSVMVAPGASPAVYEPKPRQMADLSYAEIYFAIGVPFESAWLNKIASANPNMQIVYTEKGIEKIPMEAHHHGQEDENYLLDEDDDEHTGIKDPHIWLSPPLVMIQARNILTALIESDPVHRSSYEAGYKAFINEIIDLDAEIRSIFSSKGSQTEFMVFHPAWGYFAQAYGLKQIPVEIEGKEPKSAELRKLIKRARKKDVKVIFTQPQFSDKSAGVIANAIKGEAVSIDSLELNWSANLRNAAMKFKNALTQGD